MTPKEISTYSEWRRTKIESKRMHGIHTERSPTYGHRRRSELEKKISHGGTTKENIELELKYK